MNYALVTLLNARTSGSQMAHNRVLSFSRYPCRFCIKFFEKVFKLFVITFDKWGGLNI